MYRLQDARGNTRATDRLIPDQGSSSTVHPRRGRFAPSPTGHLHAGSLVAALASRLWSPRWSIRIDDLDRPRVVHGAEQSILQSLVDCGLSTPGTAVYRQSDRLDRYNAALYTLADLGLLYECSCSRRQLAGAVVYPGHCRNNLIDADRVAARLSRPTHVISAGGGENSEVPLTTALRVRLTGSLHFIDAVQGLQSVCLDQEVGDVIVHRRDAVVAYPLAAAVDDATDNEDVVRGADLLPATAAQIAVIERLELTQPHYAHVPVLVDANGAKLGKQTGAKSIDSPLLSLEQAWRALGQRPLNANTLDNFHALAHEQWRTDWIPKALTRRLGE